MNTEDRLRRAAGEMDRVTASVTAPPMGEVRSSARMRNVGVAVAAAAAAIVLIGGSVLALRPGSEATPGPAGPRETLSPAELAELVVIAEPDHEPYFDLDESLRRDLVPVSDETIAADLELLAALDDPGFLAITEIISLGELADWRAYVVRGTWQGEGSGDPENGECFVSIGDDLSPEYCVGSGSTVSHSYEPIMLDGYEGTLVLGPAPEGSSVVAVTSDAAAVWQQTVGGYWFIAIENPGQSTLEFTIYSLSGEVRLGPLTIGEPAEPEPMPDDVAGVPVRVPDLDEEPTRRSAEIGAEVPFKLPDTLEADLARAVEFLVAESLDPDDEALVLGSQYGHRAFVFRGDVRAVGPDDDVSSEHCTVMVDPSSVTVDCALDPDPAIGALTYLHGTDGVYGLVGLAPAGASVAAIEVNGQSWWARTREGYINLMAEASTTAGATYRFFASDGGEISSGTIPYVGSGPTPPSYSCSGSGMSPAALALSSIPQPVAENLLAIVGAAEACDFAGLADLAGDNFTASFGGDDPAELWAYEEEQGYEPMFWLLSVLDLRYGTIDLGEETLYVWPAAATHDGGWNTMPEEYIDDLRAIYSDDDFEGFAQFGGYIGYRLGITESGDWSFFVVGD